jgi:hypothetical protein
MTERLAQNGSVEIEAASQEGEALLGYGWSIPESWGVWSEGMGTTLRVPAPPGSTWRATVEGRVHAPNGPVQIGIGVDLTSMHCTEIASRNPVHLTVLSTARSADLIRLDLPDARAPIDDGLSEDSRKLGIGLTRLTFELV